MKTIKTFKIILLVLVPILLLATQTVERTTKLADQMFILVPGGNPHDPLDYNPYYPSNPDISCPGQDYICVIDVYTWDVYSYWDAPTPDYVGQPMVDFTLYFDIQGALSSTVDPYVTVNGAIIWQRAAP